VANTSSVEEKQQYQLETSCRLIKFQKEPLSAILNHQLEIKDHILDVQEHMLLLLDILMMALKLELDFLQAQEKPSLDSVELLLALLLEVDEMKNLL